MNVKDLKVGCQTFTWEMLGDRFTGGPDDLSKRSPMAAMPASRSPTR